jgi:gamma-glutamyl AIG2-like cyclotransferase
MRFFFYGTLMDADVRRAVLRDRAPQAAEPAALPGWRCVPAAGRAFPMIRADRAARVDGILVRGLDRVARARLSRYEDRDYRIIKTIVVASGRAVAAHLFVPVRRRRDAEIQLVAATRGADFAGAGDRTAQSKSLREPRILQASRAWDWDSPMTRARKVLDLRRASGATSTSPFSSAFLATRIACSAAYFATSARLKVPI